ncbi:unnamed protein product [Kuraishia capsulata CBS 1993]|uniref:tRNA dimethylallyltransferase n=1 Tax=Kuraishia capsulata CBS 1993 TaxID=1382522 RepID=W6MP17_9ASCO|nr:uncharacterized protein KUCA_T00004401001 [Kuraishia capsulata CBS 1993]CDK28419.1 unnamed protein product [Kuraishia capsulata CBS 1993]
MQMYRSAAILTNKHPMREREGIPHHVMDHVGWNEEYFLHRFKAEALAAIADIHGRGKLPILVGGTHYYLQSILFNNKTIVTSNTSEAKISGEEQAILDGDPEQLITHLRKYDPEVSEKFHPNDTRRIRRALEIYFTTKKKASEFYGEQKKSDTEESPLRFNTMVFWLYSEKSVLDARLDTRVDKMMEMGAIEELKELYSAYTSFQEPPDLEKGVWQMIGFKEFLPWLESDEPETEKKVLLDQCISKMKQATRKYAKSQVKWIRNLLAPEMNMEQAHGFCKGGKIFLLDATDLHKFEENVMERGEGITKEFLEKVNVEKYHQTPGGMESLLPLSKYTDSKEKNWKHYVCEVCTDPKTEKPLVFVGSQYDIHMASNRHKNTVKRLQRRKENEKWILRKKQDTGATKS